jgi:DNA-binding Lrp family transcriptional regulator
MIDKRRKITPVIKDQIKELFRQGMSVRAIAKTMELSDNPVQAIRKEMVLDGELKPRTVMVNENRIIKNKELITILAGLTPAEEKLLNMWLSDIQNQRKVLEMIIKE